MAFGSDQGISAFPLKDSGHRPSHETINKTGLVNVPEFLMEMYHALTEDDGTLKSNRMTATIHYFIGKGRVCSVLRVK